MCANFGDTRSHDRELTLPQKNHKKRRFLARELIYYFAYNSKITQCAKLKFEHNVSAYECLMQIEFGGARLRDQNFTGQKWAESGRIWTDISR